MICFTCLFVLCPFTTSWNDCYIVFSSTSGLFTLNMFNLQTNGESQRFCTSMLYLVHIKHWGCQSYWYFFVSNCHFSTRQRTDPTWFSCVVEGFEVLRTSDPAAGQAKAGTGSVARDRFPMLQAASQFFWSKLHRVARFQVALWWSMLHFCLRPRLQHP